MMAQGDRHDLLWLDERMPYEAFADELIQTCLVNDPWYAQTPIFSSAPLAMSPPFFQRVQQVTSRIGALYDELCRIVWDSPELLDDFFGLPPFYKLMWLASGGHWHGFARLDLFLLKDGSLKICEINADTPTGQVEAIVPSRILGTSLAGYTNPNAAYAARFVEMVLQLGEQTLGRPPQHLGLLYPTDLSEDITLIRLYQQWFEARGLEVSLGSPENLTPTSEGGVALFGREIDLVLRHYKTDWWGERPPCLEDDVDILDSEALAEPLTILLGAERNRRVAVVNPFGAVLPQNKLAMAFMWEQMQRFSPQGQRTIQDHVPQTSRLDIMDRDALRADKDAWVLKADYGCEGDEVMVGANVIQADWDELLQRALPGTWIAQRHLPIQPLVDAEGGTWLPNLGPFLVGGRPEGLLVRLAPPGVTCGHDARVVCTFVGEVPNRSI